MRFEEGLIARVGAQYARQREEAGVSLEQYPFWLDEEGMSRLPADVREKVLAWFEKEKRQPDRRSIEKPI